MKEFKNKVAVITGAASGIGRGLAEYSLQKGMKVVLADVEKEALAETESELSAVGADITAIVTDVAKPADVQRLASKTIDAYDKVDLLFNNAGVAAGASLWESTHNDCKWVIGVNICGVINSIREFVPIMLKQGTSGHIINTSSIAGLSTYHPSALYHLTKHGIVALSEQLHHDLAMRKAKIKVSVLCPGAVNTNIMDAERNRPQKYLNDLSEIKEPPEPDEMEEAFRQMIQSGMQPATVAERVFQAIADEKFFIFTHPEMKPLIHARMEDILQERNPVLPPMDQH